jgi:metal-responsive CopG/Arc/MetJ family transcriptional regulator
MSKTKVISVCLDKNLIDLLDKVKERRRDQSRSNTIRTLVLQQLAEMSFLTDEEKKALGVFEAKQ